VTALVSDPRVAITALIPHPYPPGAAREWIANSLQLWQDGKRATFVMCLRESGELIGSISITCPEEGAPHAGYWTGLPYQGRGYASEALHEILRYAFDDLSLDRVHAYHVAGNSASGRVMQKAGMRFLEMVPQGFTHEGQVFDDVRYGVTASEWRSAHQLQGSTSSR